MNQTKTPSKVKFKFFWGTKDPESNFYQPVAFIDGKNTFNSSEQYFMFKKAEYFRDTKVLLEIMDSKDPAKQKQLGRTVSGFDSQDWDKVCRRFMYEAVHLKFSQNEFLKKHLLESVGMENVEASPYDDIWGIKLRESDYRASIKSEWKGKNWLGIILDEVRDELVKELPMSETRYK
jgi:ribA/ribD-fused uncharacterized protein